MGGIEPPMSVPRRWRGGIGSGGQALFHRVDAEGLDAVGQRRQSLGFELQQTRSLDRRNGLLALFLFELSAPFFQSTRIFFERQTLLFQCLCHMGLLFNANRAMNTVTIAAIATRWKKQVRAGRIGLNAR